MLVTLAAPPRSPWRRWLALRPTGALLLVLAVLLVAPQLRSGTELVRARHALTLGPDLALDEDWQPPMLPVGFKTETVPTMPYFVAVADRLRLETRPDDWARALAISAHLLAAPQRRGGAIRNNLATTHRRIIERGDGYCGDFVRVFVAIANAAGMTVRPWAFSFDGFGGHGHIWVEVWNRQARAWQLVDVFQNYAYTLADGVPLSARQLRSALEAHDPALRLAPLWAAAQPAWVIESKAWDYLRRGLAEWYAPWGNNVQSIDVAPPVRAVSGVSRVLETLAAIALGLRPSIRMLATPASAAQREDMRALRARLLVASGSGLAGAVLLVAALFVPRRRRAAVASRERLRVGVVGPLPPPSGGMANQCEQLLRLLRAEGVQVVHVRTNAPYRPALVARVPVVRALPRLLDYVVELWRVVRHCDVLHVFANSGWAWHLFAAPAMVVARLAGVPVIVNYRGGLADEFLRRAPRGVLGRLRGAALLVTPSVYLQRVFAKHGLAAEVVPNIVDLSRFTPRPRRAFGDAPHLLVARNLEPIYDIPTAIRALVRVREHYPNATLTVAGSGPELPALQALVTDLGLDGAVRFTGRVENAAMPQLYAQADCVVNPSTADNMPISILEAFASGVPVVSTRAGGIPDLLEDGVTGLLVGVGEAEAMAQAACRVLGDERLAARLTEAALTEAQRYGWPRVKTLWLEAYGRAAATKGLP